MSLFDIFPRKWPNSHLKQTHVPPVYNLEVLRDNHYTDIGKHKCVVKKILDFGLEASPL